MKIIKTTLVRCYSNANIILFATLMVTACNSTADQASSDDLKFTSPPVIEQNPNPAVPLAAVLSFEATGASSTSIQIKDGERDWTIDLDKLPSEDQPLPVLGMRADREHEIIVSICDDEKNCQTADQPLTYKTPPLPVDRYVFPVYQVNEAKADKMEPGLTIVSLRRDPRMRGQDRNKQQQKFVIGYGLLLGLDHEGEVVWYYQSDDRISGIERLKNGNILYHLASFETVEIDMLGNKIRSWYAEKRPQGPSKTPLATPIKGIQTLHHQPHETERGTFLSFSANWRVIKNWYTNEFDPEPRKDQKVMGDTIIEFDKDGSIVWSWNAFDYLDTDIIGYEAFNPYWVTRGFPDTWDWSHGNGVSYDHRDDSIVASFKLLDAVIKIDRKTKEIKWILSDPALWKGELKEKLLTPVGDDFRYPWHQHNPRWTHAGTLMVFNNNRAQARPFDGREHRPYEESYSYTVEYEIDEEAGTVSQAFVSEPEMTAASCFSSAMSESHRLPITDNVLEITAICGNAGLENITTHIWDRSKRFMSEIPNWGRIREYNRHDPTDILFDVTFADPYRVISWQAFGGFRTPSLYWTADK